MKVKLLSVAEQEFVEAVDYYNDQCQGLGYEFAAEISNTIERIVSFPKAWTKISPRRIKLKISCDLEPVPFPPDKFTPDDPFVRLILETGVPIRHS